MLRVRQSRARPGQRCAEKKATPAFKMEASSLHPPTPAHAPISPFAPVVLSHPRLPITAHVIPFGLNVTRLVFQNPSSGETHDVIAGPEEPSDHWQQGRTFLGPLVGRYANRLPAGKCRFPGGELDLPEFCECRSAKWEDVARVLTDGYSWPRRMLARRASSADAAERHCRGKRACSRRPA